MAPGSLALDEMVFLPMTKKRKAFKTSPSIRVPRAAVSKMHAAAAAAAKTSKLRHSFIVELVAMLDASRFGARSYRCLTPAEEARLRIIRTLEGVE